MDDSAPCRARIGISVLCHSLPQLRHSVRLQLAVSNVSAPVRQPQPHLVRQLQLRLLGSGRPVRRSVLLQQQQLGLA